MKKYFLAIGITLLLSSHVCADEYSEAIDYISSTEARPVNETDMSYYRAIVAFYNYDFDTATELLKDFRSKQKTASPEVSQLSDDLSRRLDIGKRMMAHADKITVIDSIAVDSDHFFSRYRIPTSAGKIIAPAEIPLPELRDVASMAYSNEQGDYLLWSQPDSIGTLRIAEANRLTDGTWTTPAYLTERLNDGGDADFPFLASDGSMLYYSSDGDGSLGGFDIYAAARDTSDGEFLDPMNLGMPFNSPSDDFLLVYDEENGVGWWASDRNHLPGMLTIYIFLADDEREELSDDDDARLYASLNPYKATWNPDADYTSLLDRLSHIENEATDHSDFRLQITSGRVYTRYSDFRSRKAEKAMRDYMRHNDLQRTDLNKLAELRKKYYAHHSDALASDILRLESATEQRAEVMKRLLNEVYTLERQAL